MDKNALISRFSETSDEKVILSHIFDLAERSYSRSTVEASEFLSDSLRMRAEQMLSLSDYREYFFWGGYDDAERTCAVFCTDYCNPDDVKASPELAELVFVKAELDRFNKDASLSHRDVLGSLMGLGIERDAVGDILVEDGYTVFVLKSAILPFVKENLSKIGRYPVRLTAYDFYEMKRKEDFENCFDTVASLRLDAVVASVFSTSRSIASEAIEEGLVSINGAVVKKPDGSVNQGDKISFRGRGRVELESLDGLSKKGRQRISFKRWK